MRHRSIRHAIPLLLVVALAASLFVIPSTAVAATAKELHDQLVAIQSEAQGVADAWDAASTKLEGTDYRIKLTDARLRSDLKKQRQMERALGQRVDAMYRGGGQTDMLNFILGATSWDDLSTRLAYVELISNRDAQLISTVKGARERSRLRRIELVKERKVRAADAAEMKKKQDAMQAKLDSAKSRYNEKLAQLKAQMEQEKRLGHRTYMPKSPGGMVFPVQGPCSYSDTWGAPRSGGRRHKGTDIMAARGVPVVAVLSGNARPHYNGLGGKSITLTAGRWQFYYAHLDRYAISGGHVRAGQVIGYVGNTGNASGGACHVHFQMGPGGNWVDPYPYLRMMQ